MKIRLSSVLRGALAFALSLSPLAACRRAPPIDCTDSTAQLNGLTACGDVQIRDKNNACFGPGKGNSAGCPGTNTCATDADCPGAMGRCDDTEEGNCKCETGCMDDSDCPDGKTCFCSSDGGRCIESTCRTSADCETDQRCILYQWLTNCGNSAYPRFGCTTGGDECHVDADCGQNGSCLYRDGAFVCDGAGCMY